MEKPWVSIITPTYNRADSGFLEKNLNSVLSQEVNGFGFEHILIDDGSTDSTKTIIHEFAEKNRGSGTIRYLHQENQGPAIAIKRGISEASGMFSIILDDDDELTADSLTIRWKNYLEHPDVDLFYGLARYIDELNQETPELFQSREVNEFRYEEALVGNFIHSGTTTIRTRLLQGLEWPSWLIRSQDYFIYLEVLRPKNNVSVKFINSYIVNYRVHSESYTSKLSESSEDYEKKLMLNSRIRSLHPSNLHHLAKLVNTYKNQAWDNNIYWVTFIEQLNSMCANSAQELKTIGFDEKSLEMTNDLIRTIQNRFKQHNQP